MFPKWSAENNYTKISVFMKNLDPDKLYSTKDFLELTNSSNITNISQLQKNSMGNFGHGFGMIIKKVGSQYMLYHELKNEYKKYF